MRSARGERAIQDEYFEFFIVAETPKMAKISFQSFDGITKKKSLKL